MPSIKEHDDEQIDSARHPAFLTEKVFRNIGIKRPISPP